MDYLRNTILALLSFPLNPAVSPSMQWQFIKGKSKELEIHFIGLEKEKLVKNISRLHAVLKPDWYLQQEKDISGKINELWIESGA